MDLHHVQCSIRPAGNAQGDGKSLFPEGRTIEWHKKCSVHASPTSHDGRIVVVNRSCVRRNRYRRPRQESPAGFLPTTVSLLFSPLRRSQRSCPHSSLLHACVPTEWLGR